MLTKLRIMYWKEIPVQVQAEDSDGQISKPLNSRFQEGVDAISMFDGSNGTDDYLNGWSWGPDEVLAHNKQEILDKTVCKFNQHFPQNFVARIRDLHKSGLRDPRPSAIDHWMEKQ